MKYAVQTFFDITATGITGHFKPARIPFRDNAGNAITDQELWNRSRNQQRNWETITQILSLRTQLFRLQAPVANNLADTWMFEFETESDHIYGNDNDPTSVLTADSAGVPMLLGLNNRPELKPFIVTNGPFQNIWFMLMS
jgi:hypothetical protein|tara:strand:+ start:941 stop:1360 length:420 start_codon:yes stop_codon:yes gene_type:complete